ncbi:hypothetical protein [Arthrobacter sp. AZCC_0090]|uniref:hypothetical protein n=1 Tax=Arthrobacter sp. AZCC_0090 TaxID=2735881 RepID=UPI001609B6F4|nr:hypothetical protein [Arthrobacter sp. AZCC_0090]MBB6403174.1 hypothetical protein [Arthrobacter sp. AZCC_0090]
MTDPLRGRATAFLGRIGLLAALLSIIAGILGMHVMGGSHSMHDPIAIGINAQEPGTHGGHAVLPGDPSPPAGASIRQSAQLPASHCTSSGACTTMSAMSAVCVPAPSHNSLAAPLPGVPPYANEGTAEAGAPIAGYSHRPGSPSPGDLCISRT